MLYFSKTAVLQEKAMDNGKMTFIHLADVHLGASPDGRAAWSKSRRDEIWDTFRETIADAREAGADLVLISGDLFHRPPGEEELREVNYLFSTLPSARVALIAGNHDHIGPGSAWENFQWNRNVAFLSSAECECVRFPEIHTEVYGFSYHQSEITSPLYDGLSPARGNGCRILLAHGGDAMHIPLSARTFAHSGFSYVALGHIHHPQALIPDRAVYAGALSPIDCADEGPHGYVLGTWEHGKVRTTFVPKAKREYVRITLPVTPEDTTYSLRDRLEKEMEKKGWQHIYRVTLTGTRDPQIQFDTDRLAEYGMVLAVDDETLPDLDIEGLREKYRGGLIGSYIDSFGKDPASPVERRALSLGLEALLRAQGR